MSNLNSIINQSYKNFEHIIVDGQSSDGTLEILNNLQKKYKFKLIVKKDKSMYEAISNGFKISKGSYFYWLNSDDLYNHKLLHFLCTWLKLSMVIQDEILYF